MVLAIREDRGCNSIGYSAYYYRTPYLMVDETMKQLARQRKEGCIEWDKKEHEGSCGCGGRATCECGYTTTYCTPLYIDKCPYCSRKLKLENTKRWFDIESIICYSDGLKLPEGTNEC
jgi:hypothetical protein